MNKKKVAGDLAGALERARALRPKLSEATDRLNQAIVEAEKAIAALQLGVRASVVLHHTPPNADQPLGWYEYLTFGKEGRIWRLLIETGDDVNPEYDVIPLVNASRELRLQAIEKLHDLVEEMIAKAESTVQEVEQKTAEVKQFVASITGEADR